MSPNAESGVVIAPIKADQVTAYHEVVDALARERKHLAFFEAPPLERAIEFVERNIRKGFPQYLATDGGRVVGWCDIIPKYKPTQTHIGALGMGLLPDYRGRGCGRALLGSTLAAARAFGFVRIELEVNSENTPAIALYESFGFEEEGRLRLATSIDGVYQDLVVMGLLDQSHLADS